MVPEPKPNLDHSMITADPTTAQMLAIQLTQAHTAMRAVRSILKASIKPKAGNNTAVITAALSILDENLQ